MWNLGNLRKPGRLLTSRLTLSTSWTRGGKSDGKGDRSKGGNHGGGRNGLEPKCIGLLVNVYRYNDTNSHRDWNRVMQSADIIFNGRDKIYRQVTSALSRAKKL